MDKTTLSFLGDVFFGGEFLSSSSSLDSNVLDKFKKLKIELATSELVCANLESPFFKSSSPRLKRSVLLDSPESSVSILNYINCNVANIGNNHITDYGLDALTKTKDLLEDKNIMHFGAAENLEKAKKAIDF